MCTPKFCGLIILSALLALAGCGGSSSASFEQQPVTVSITNSPCLASSQPPCPIGVGANFQYAATVTGTTTPNPTITWSLSPAAASSGSIDQTGLYVAPNTPPSGTVTIQATLPGASQQGSTSVTVQANDPIGTISSSSQLSSCAGSVEGATCYQLAVSCPGVADLSVYLKVNNPLIAPVGTVLLGTGTGGSGLYDDPNAGGYTDGSSVVQSLLNNGYNTVQVSFGAPFDSTQPNGWLTGPGGVRRLACRYATVADWVYRNPGKINSGGSAANSAPMCATGNSGGSSAIAYAVYEYGLASGTPPELVMIEPTSGPVMSRIDQGCSPSCANLTGPICPSSSNVATMCYEPMDASVIDEAYQAAGATTPTPCADSINGNPASNAANLFLSDSILYAPGLPVNFPNTIVKQLFGDLDTSNAVPEGFTWEQAITPSSQSPNPPYQCLANVQHDIPSFTSGATQIANDIMAGCH